MPLLIALILVVVGATACAPRSNPPKPEPPRLPSGAGANIYVMIETDMADLNQPGHYIPTVRTIGVTINAFGADGRMAGNKDPATGQTRPPIILESWKTPLPYRIELEPGVVAMEITIHLFGKRGERVKCHIEEDGQPVSGTDNKTEITVEHGLAIVNCYWH